MARRRTADIMLAVIDQAAAFWKRPKARKLLLTMLTPPKVKWLSLKSPPERKNE